MKINIIILLLTFIYSGQSQTLDLLKDFEPGKRIIFSFEREGFPTYFSPDTSSTFNAFSGRIEVSTDSIVSSKIDSIKYYYLTTRKIGIETITKINRIVSTKNIDTKSKKVIKEYLTINYNAGGHKLTGWFFPDTVQAMPVCPDAPDSNKIYYHYPYYFRYYTFPTLDTLDFHSDSLFISDFWTDCLDYGCYWDFTATVNEGLVEIETYYFNWFDWSIREHYKKTEVTTSIPNTHLLNSYYLYQNYPNPFNSTTNIKYLLSKPGYVKIEIFNILGKSVRVLFEGYNTSGMHHLTFDASSMSSGVYFYTIKTKEFIHSRKLLYLK